MIHEARNALNALRTEHKAEMRRKAEEAERQRQILLGTLKIRFSFHLFQILCKAP